MLQLAILTLTDSEVTFIKFIGYLLPLLWIAYLVKELFFPQKHDPRVDQLVLAVGTMATNGAASGVRIENMERRISEIASQQRHDTQLLFKELKDYNEGVQAVLRDHEHELAVKSRPR